MWKKGLLRRIIAWQESARAAAGRAHPGPRASDKHSNRPAFFQQMIGASKQRAFEDGNGPRRCFAETFEQNLNVGVLTYLPRWPTKLAGRGRSSSFEKPSEVTFNVGEPTFSPL